MEMFHCVTHNKIDYGFQEKLTMNVCHAKLYAEIHVSYFVILVSVHVFRLLIIVKHLLIMSARIW